VPERPAADGSHPLEPVSWPCRYCQSRGTVVITWRDAIVWVCFCRACEQGWRATDRGQPVD